jgi:dihydroflavonol-4-reductase
MALFDPGIRSITNQLGKKLAYSNEKARTTVDWAPRPIEQTIAETGRSMVDLGAV